MKTLDVMHLLADWDKKGRYVWAKRDLAKLLGSPPANSLDQMLKRLVAQGVLIRAARGVYVFAQSPHITATTIEDVAIALRPGEYSFESMESALSQWGAISQIPIDRVTLVTTGRRGEYKTPFGTIEFTHTESSPQEILENTMERPGHPLPLATEEYASTNLKRSRRNVNMLREDG